MTRRMLIDAIHQEETRVVIAQDQYLEEFDFETTAKRQIKGNIYLAKVTRVEPSLQACFVEYGGSRQGFLAFSEIHPDYFQIPAEDREAFIQLNELIGRRAEGGDEAQGQEEDEIAEPMTREQRYDRIRKLRQQISQYKIQEVIKRRQILLVQAIKEERGAKGAAMTTYLSLAGRYCVLMPNSSRGGGVSRKISNGEDRQRLKKILQELQPSKQMAVILRTAGAERSRAEIHRDYEFIIKLWDEIREKTLSSIAPCLIHEEGNLVKRAIRDLYSKDIDEVLVAGEEAYRTARDFMRSLIPSHARKVKLFKDSEDVPLLHRYRIESQLARIHESRIDLRSGGSIVINQTEALVAIDVNSGKATRERHIEETALKTNLEAAEEIARQLRLRDLAGLIVIDFIDMEENRNDITVERRLKEMLRRDRARIQVGRISDFGLLEMSRQRMRPSLLEAISQACPHCGGAGYVISTENAALTIIRTIEEEALKRTIGQLTLKLPTKVALYILNNKRQKLIDLEASYGLFVTILADDDILPPHYEVVGREALPQGEFPHPTQQTVSADHDDGEHDIELSEDGEDAEDQAQDQPNGQRSGAKSRHQEQASRASRHQRSRKSRSERADIHGEDKDYPKVISSELALAQVDQQADDFIGDQDQPDYEDSTESSRGYGDRVNGQEGDNGERGTGERGRKRRKRNRRDWRNRDRADDVNLGSEKTDQPQQIDQASDGEAMAESAHDTGHRRFDSYAEGAQGRRRQSRNFLRRRRFANPSPDNAGDRDDANANHPHQTTPRAMQPTHIPIVVNHHSAPSSRDEAQQKGNPTLDDKPVSDVAQASDAPKKRRGRPKNEPKPTHKETGPAGESILTQPHSPSKGEGDGGTLKAKRGRPKKEAPKASAPIGSDNIQGEPSEEGIAAQPAKRRGRPAKASNPEKGGEGKSKPDKALTEAAPSTPLAPAKDDTRADGPAEPRKGWWKRILE